MDHSELQFAINATCDLLGSVEPSSEAKPALRDHLDGLLAAQAGRALNLHMDGAPIDIEIASSTADRSAHGDTVIDPTRGLMWTRRPITTNRLNFKAAEAACVSCRIDGHTDWRLPTREELQSLVDYNRYNPAINSELFPDTPPNYFWSSSPVASDPDYAWIVLFDNGSVNLSSRAYSAFVRAVRSLPASQ